MGKAKAALQSMTGFARTEGQFESGQVSWRWTWEARSLNNRGLDLKCRLPGWLENLEAEVRKRISASISRGSVTIGLQLKSGEGEGRLSLSEAALAQVIEAAEKVQQQTKCAPATADGLLGLRGVLNLEEDQHTPETLKAVSAALLQSFDTLLAGLVDARQAEGAKLDTVLEAQISQIEGLAKSARATAETMPAAIRDRLQAQLQELIADGLEPDRLAQEVALLAVKADIREELDRLDAHIDAARQLLAEASVIGRKFDFLIQEFNREANTLCSKAQTIELKQTGLELKTVIDQMREQIQNVE